MERSKLEYKGSGYNWPSSYGSIKLFSFCLHMRDIYIHGNIYIYVYVSDNICIWFFLFVHTYLSTWAFLWNLSDCQDLFTLKFWLILKWQARFCNEYTRWHHCGSCLGFTLPREVSPLGSGSATQVALRFRSHALRDDCTWSVSPSAAVSRVHEIKIQKSFLPRVSIYNMRVHLDEQTSRVSEHLQDPLAPQTCDHSVQWQPKIQANHACVVWKYKFKRFGGTLNFSKNSLI